MKKLRVIDGANVPETGVLKSPEVEHLSVSSKIIAETENWSREVRKAHMEKLEQERAVACEKAYVEGLATLLETRDGFLTTANELTGRLEELLKVCLKRVLLVAPPDDILRAVLTPIADELRKEAAVCVVVHPARVSALRQVLQDCSADPDVFEIDEDEKLSEGECQIYTGSSVITVGVPLLVDRLMQALRTHLGRQEHEPAF